MLICNYLLNVHYVPDTSQGTGRTAVNKTNEIILAGCVTNKKILVRDSAIQIIKAR